VPSASTPTVAVAPWGENAETATAPARATNTITIAAPIGTLHRERRAKPGTTVGTVGAASTVGTVCAVGTAGTAGTVGTVGTALADTPSPSPALSSPRILSTLMAEGYDGDARVPPSSVVPVA
jgi:hypothetical protein